MFDSTKMQHNFINKKSCNNRVKRYLGSKIENNRYFPGRTIQGNLVCYDILLNYQFAQQPLGQSASQTDRQIDRQKEE